MTPPQRLVVPGWAERAIQALGDAQTAGYGPGGRFTRAEEDLIDAVWMLLRHRFGKSERGDPTGVVLYLIDYAAEHGLTLVQASLRDLGDVADQDRVIARRTAERDTAVRSRP